MLISVFWWKNILLVIFGYLSIEILTKNFDDVSTFEKIRNFDYFSGFCSPEFDCLVRDLAIF